MPFETQEPWKRQFYSSTECPEHVVIPLKDYNAYGPNPVHRWVYNKLEIAEKQGLACAPHGIAPEKFPVFSKPIYNIRNLGAGTRILEDMEDYREHCSSGHMWSELLEGDHISTDVAVLDGKVVWLSHTLGIPSGGGTFDRWEVNIAVPQQDERTLVDFIELHLPDYRGMLNAEMIARAYLDFAQELFKPFQKMPLWEERVRKIGHGSNRVIDIAEAHESARCSTPLPGHSVDSEDALGLSPGDDVIVTPDDYGQGHTTGRLVTLTPREVAVVRDDPLVGQVIVHFPRIGFRISRSSKP